MYLFSHYTDTCEFHRRVWCNVYTGRFMYFRVSRRNRMKNRLVSHSSWVQPPQDRTVSELIFLGAQNWSIQGDPAYVFLSTQKVGVVLKIFSGFSDSLLLLPPPPFKESANCLQITSAAPKKYKRINSELRSPALMSTPSSLLIGSILTETSETEEMFLVCFWKAFFSTMLLVIWSDRHREAQGKSEPLHVISSMPSITRGRKTKGLVNL